MNPKIEKNEKIGEEILRVAGNFKELDIFKGRFLRRIYEHKAEVEANDAEYQRDCAAEVKRNLPPFKIQEYR